MRLEVWGGSFRKLLFSVIDKSQSEDVGEDIGGLKGEEKL